MTLDQTLTEDDTLVTMPHADTNGDKIYSFGSSGGDDDGSNVADDEEGMSDGDGAGFGAIVALLPILGSVFAARRMQPAERWTVDSGWSDHPAGTPALAGRVGRLRSSFEGPFPLSDNTYLSPAFVTVFHVTRATTSYELNPRNSAVSRRGMAKGLSGFRTNVLLGSRPRNSWFSTSGAGRNPS